MRAALAGLLVLACRTTAPTVPGTVPFENLSDLGPARGGPALVVVASRDEVPLLTSESMSTRVQDRNDRISGARFERERIVALVADRSAVREIRRDGDAVRVRVDAGRDQPFAVLSVPEGRLPFTRGTRWIVEDGERVLIDHVYCGVEEQRMDRPFESEARACFLAARRAGRTSQFLFLARTSEGEPVPLYVKSTAAGRIEIARDRRGLGERVFSYVCEDARTNENGQLEFIRCTGDGPETGGP